MLLPHIRRTDMILGEEVGVTWDVAHELLVVQRMVYEIVHLCPRGHDSHLDRAQAKSLQTLARLELNEGDA